MFHMETKHADVSARSRRARFHVLLAVLTATVSGALITPATAQPGTTERVSVSSSGAQGDNDSGFNGIAISADGRFVAFLSWATNLVSSDTNGTWDVFVRDRLLGTTERVSVSSSGEQGNYDSSGDYAIAISADGRFVAFDSYATNLVSGDTNGRWDVFVRDRLLGTTELVSVSSSGAQGNSESGYSDAPSISADGRFVAFSSDASNFVSGDTNGRRDVFVRDRLLGTTERVSVSSSGAQGNNDSGYEGIAISSDGRFVAFPSYATNLVSGDTDGCKDVFVRDRLLGTTERVSVSSSGEQGNSYGSDFSSISSDGRFVAFESFASNLVSGDTNGTEDVFVRDRLLGTTELVSVSSSGAQGNRDSYYASISSDGRFVAFISDASNLVSGDTNGYPDVFVHQLATPVAVTGKLSFDNFAGTSIGMAAFELRVAAQPTLTWTASVAADGSFSVPAPVGPFDLSVKVSNWLRKTVHVDTTSGNQDVGTLELINGDAWQDNKVDLLDLSTVLANFGTAGTPPIDGDLDWNGRVDLLDLSTVLANFGLVGDP